MGHCSQMSPNELGKMDNQSKPKISVSLSISPATHSYASSQAPNLNLMITSQHSDPITIYTDDLSPSLMLTCGAFIITSLANGCEIKQSVRKNCRFPPPSKVAVPLNDRMFHTLLPNTPLPSPHHLVEAVGTKVANLYLRATQIMRVIGQPDSVHAVSMVSSLEMTMW